MDKADIEEMLQQIQLKIDEVEAHDLRTRDMARLAGLEDMYRTAYATLSGAVHSTVGDLDEHFKIDPDGQVLELVTAPVVEHLEGPFLILGETMVGLIRAATKVFNLGVADQCEEHLSRLHKLYPDAAG